MSTVGDQIAQEEYDRFMRLMKETARIAMRYQARGYFKTKDKFIEKYKLYKQERMSVNDRAQTLRRDVYSIERQIAAAREKGLISSEQEQRLNAALETNFCKSDNLRDFVWKETLLDNMAQDITEGREDLYKSLSEHIVAGMNTKVFEQNLPENVRAEIKKATQQFDKEYEINPDDNLPSPAIQSELVRGGQVQEQTHTQSMQLNDHVKAQSVRTVNEPKRDEYALYTQLGNARHQAVTDISNAKSVPENTKEELIQKVNRSFSNFKNQEELDEKLKSLQNISQLAKSGDEKSLSRADRLATSFDPKRGLTPERPHEHKADINSLPFDKFLVQHTKQFNERQAMMPKAQVQSKSLGMDMDGR